MYLDYKRDTKVNIICPSHGIFEQSFHKHLQGDGCKKCSKERVAKEIIERAKQKFKQEAQVFLQYTIVIFFYKCYYQVLLD
jgi:hypothetical protein